jgi:putative ABC transport system substrate-binding protein
MPRIGLAIPVDRATDAPYQNAFREGLRELGYVDGKNVSLMVRYANGDPAKYRELIQELIAMRVDVLRGEARELREATKTIPIVSPTMDWGDPVRSGLVASLARPGGNLTGPSSQRHDIDPKLLQLTKELRPAAKRICLVFDARPELNLPDYANNDFRGFAREVGLSVRTIPILTLEDAHRVPRIIDQERPQAILVWVSPLIAQQRQILLGPVASRIPVIGNFSGFAAGGAVLTYSVDLIDRFRLSAAYVAKILRGAKPGDLPIEQPTKFRMVVNLKAAETLGIKVPESILVQADEVIR